MHSRTDPRKKIVDKDSRLVRIGVFRIEHVIFSVSSSCFDLGEVGDETGCNT